MLEGRLLADGDTIRVLAAVPHDVEQFIRTETGEDEVALDPSWRRPSQRWPLDASEDPPIIMWASSKLCWEQRRSDCWFWKARMTDRGVVEMRRLVVAADQRGRGTVRYVLRRVFRSPALPGARADWPDVHPDSLQARRLDESEGFSVVSDPAAVPRKAAASKLLATHRLCGVGATGRGATRSDRCGDGCLTTHLVRQPGLSVIMETLPPAAPEVAHLHGRAWQHFPVVAGSATIWVDPWSTPRAAGEGYTIQPAYALSAGELLKSAPPKSRWSWQPSKEWQPAASLIASKVGPPLPLLVKPTHSLSEQGVEWTSR